MNDNDGAGAPKKPSKPATPVKPAEYRAALRRVQDAATPRIEDQFYVLLAYQKIIEIIESELKRLKSAEKHWRETVLPMRLMDASVEKQEIEFDHNSFAIAIDSGMYDIVDFTLALRSFCASDNRIKFWKIYRDKNEQCCSPPSDIGKFHGGTQYTVRLAHEVHASVHDNDWSQCFNILLDHGYADKVEEIPATWKIHGGSLKSAIKKIREEGKLDDRTKQLFRVHEYESAVIRRRPAAKNSANAE